MERETDRHKVLGEEPFSSLKHTMVLQLALSDRNIHNSATHGSLTIFTDNKFKTILSKDVQILYQNCFIDSGEVEVLRTEKDKNKTRSVVKLLA